MVAAVMELVIVVVVAVVETVLNWRSNIDCW